MILKHRVKILAFFIALLASGGYYFLIRTPLHHLELTKNVTQRKSVVTINKQSDKKMMRRLNVDRPTFLSNLLTQAKHNSILLQNITPSTPKQHHHYKIETFTLSATGNYFELIFFLKFISNLPYIISFRQIELAKSSPQQIILHMIIEVYHY